MSGTIFDHFNEATGLDATVDADRKTLDADTSLDVAAHAVLVASVIANGPTILPLPDGTFVGLVPQADGTLASTVFKDGRLAVDAPPVDAPPAPATLV